MKRTFVLFIVCVSTGSIFSFGQAPVAQNTNPAAAVGAPSAPVVPNSDVNAARPTEPQAALPQTGAVNRVAPVPGAAVNGGPQQTVGRKPMQAANKSQQSAGGFVAGREMVEEEEEKPSVRRVSYNPKSKRDPTLSPDDMLLIQYREQQRLAAIEAERQRKEAEEKRKQEEAERLRQLELERIKDPTREVRNKIRISGVIGEEVFIGSKIYTIGNTIYGAKIVAVHPDKDEVVFSYKGHRFVRKVKL